MDDKRLNGNEEKGEIQAKGGPSEKKTFLDGEERSSLDEFGSGLVVHGEEHVFFNIRKPKTVHWSIAWSDLMMTMFILFLVMYVYQAANREFVIGEGRKHAATPPQSFPEQMTDDMGEVGQKTRRLEYMDEIGAIDLVADKAVRIILPSDLLFDPGRAELKERARQSLSEIAEVIRQSPFMVNVVGHTDNVPINSDQFATNWELSAIRACVVARFLIEDMGLPENRFYITGHAYNRPVRPNDSLTNRAANRRVEIIITKDVPYALKGSIEDLP